MPIFLALVSGTKTSFDKHNGLILIQVTFNFGKD